MRLADQIVSRYFGSSEGELTIGGVRVSRIAEEFDTPLFVYDASVLEKKWSRLREALPSRIEIYYSVKANPNPAIVKAFLDRGCGLEIASKGELRLALQAGGAPERIVFAGPGKRDEEIREFLEAKGGELHVESANEAKRLVRLCEETGRNTAAAVRINPSAEAQGGAMRMGGKPAPFGVDEENVEEVVKTLRSSSRIRVTGVHIFAGTQILDAAILGTQYRKCIELARNVAPLLSGPLTTVDFGGGLGIPYFEGDSELDMEAYGREVRELVDALDDETFGRTRLMVEPGRYLVGEAGVYVTSVVDVKTSRGKKFVILDGGMNHHLAASGNLGQVIKRNFPVAALEKIGESASDPVEIVGPLCTPLDVLARNVEMPAIEVGDLVGIFQSGAYALTASPLGFLSHPAPPEVLVSRGELREIRARG